MGNWRQWARDGAFEGVKGYVLACLGSGVVLHAAGALGAVIGGAAGAVLFEWIGTARQRRRAVHSKPAT